MRKMIWLLSVAIVLVSFCGFISSVAVWWLGCGKYLACSWDSEYVDWTFGSSQGRIEFDRLWVEPGESESLDVGVHFINRPKQDIDKAVVKWIFKHPFWNHYRFKVYQDTTFKYYEFDLHEHPQKKIMEKWAMTIPCWAPVLLTGFLPLLWGLRFAIRWKRNRANGRGFDMLQTSLPLAGGIEMPTR